MDLDTFYEKKFSKMGMFWGYRLLRWWSSVKKLSPRNAVTSLHA
jgi:hypothetical protein